ncbi:MAG: hypothetical protein JXN63_06755 [Candidatus Delongbacteria bacterium]|nr:hypothetical protein [Candidatus Delongbacteria bacterium]
MTEREKYIKDLEVFKRLINLWYQENHDVSIEIQIKSLNKKIQSLVKKAGTEKRFDVIRNYSDSGIKGSDLNPFDHILESPLGFKSVIPLTIDIIDDTIRVIEADEDFTLKSNEPSENFTIEENKKKIDNNEAEGEKMENKNSITKQITVGVIIGVIATLIVSVVGIYFTLYKDVIKLEVEYIALDKRFDKIDISKLDNSTLRDSLKEYKLTIDEIKHQVEDLNNRIAKSNIKETKTQIKQESPKNEAKNVIFNEKFDDNIRNWPTDNNSKHKVYFANGRMVIESNDQYVYRYTTNTIKNLPNDFDLVLDVIWSEGNSMDSFGLRIGNPDNYFLFEVTQKGHARIQFKDIKTLVEEKPWTSGFEIPIKEGFKIKVSHRSSGLTYYINDNLVGQCHDNNITFDLIGFFVIGFLTVEFDELAIIGV